MSGTDSVTINVSQGTPGYYFYIKKNGKETDFIPESAYTHFDKLPARLPINDGKGSYRVYVKSADNCNPVSQNFSVIGISNIITPNGDGANDFIDYSDLMTKLDPRFERSFLEGHRKIATSGMENLRVGNFLLLRTGIFWNGMSLQLHRERRSPAGSF